MAEDEISHDGTTYSEDQLLHLVNEVKDYQVTHGSLLKLVQFETESSVAARVVGISILPTPFPRQCFQEATELQKLYTELYIHVASDLDWLYSVLEPLIEHDPFIAALWDIYIKVRDAGAGQKFVCGLFRSDYMLHQPSGASEPCLKQVEMNTFSCAGACHAQRAANMHQHLSKKRGVHDFGDVMHDQRLPQSDNTESIVHMLKLAHDAYLTEGGSTLETPKCVLITVQPFNFNIADERPIEYALWRAGVPCYRCEWQTVLERTTLAEDGALMFRPTISLGNSHELEVSVVYYRGGYAAEEYRDRSKETRLRFEMSRAVKCPDLLTHLTTFKCVQQALTCQGAVEKFMSKEKAERIRKTFMPMQVLDSSPEGMKARKMALDPEQATNYVLKPNLEGGGHNIYKVDIPDFLEKTPHWHMYTLMRLIEPPPTTGTLMMPEDLYHGAVISELGMLGTCLWKRTNNGVEILQNDLAGWTFKTKPAEIDEMSVVKGYGCFDCPLLD